MVDNGNRERTWSVTLKALCVRKRYLRYDAAVETG